MDDDEMPAEIDFSKGVRGLRRYQRSIEIVFLRSENTAVRKLCTQCHRCRGSLPDIA